MTEKTGPDNIDDRIAKWHDGPSTQPLHEYLGWTWEQYKAWGERNVYPQSTQDTYGPWAVSYGPGAQPSKIIIEEK
jgi:hypothetical protein